MKSIYTSLCALAILFLCSGCFDIVEQVSINEDGSGKFKIIVNLSQSKDNIKGVLAKDTFMGKPLPKISDIRMKMDEAKDRLAKQSGISNVELKKDFTNYLFTLTCDFSDVASLDKALVNVIQSYEEQGRKIPTGNYVYDGKTFKRQVKYDYTEETRGKVSGQAESILSKAKFTAIYRFPKAATSMSNGRAKKSPSGKAVMLSVSMLDIANSEKVIANTITLE